MKWLPFVLFLLLSSPGFGQDWLPAVEGNQYFYSATPGTGLIEGFRVDSLNEDSQTSYFNRRAALCDGCLDCFAQSYSIFGFSILGQGFAEQGDSLYVFGTNSFVIPLAAEEDESWEFSSEYEVTAFVDSIVWQPVFEEMDSVMHISTSEDHYYSLSKEHGFLSFWSLEDSIQYHLIGIRGMNQGEYPPGFDQVFGSQVGDVTMYHGGWVDNPNACFRYIRREILGRFETEESVTLEVHEIYASDLDDSWDGDTDDPYVEYEVYERSEWTMLDLLPGEVYNFGVNSYSSADFYHTPDHYKEPSNTLVRGQYFAGKPVLTLEMSYLPYDDEDYYFFDDLIYSMDRFYLIGNTDSLGQFCAGPGGGSLVDHGYIFGERVGFMYVSLTDVAAGHYNLIGSELDNEIIGEFLSVETHQWESQFETFPNPSNGNFKIRVLPAQEGTFTLTDINGRIIKQQYLNAGTHTFDLDLTPGVYLLSGNQNEVVKVLVR